MILYIMLVVLGFALASLVFVLIAPSFWNRAVRLTKMRMESAMPLSLSEIEADKDQLRATFAVRIRRLESALTKAKEKSAHQLVEISRHQMAITNLKDQIVAMERMLDERRNAAAVFEMTIKKRFPELEDALAAAQQALASRAYELTDLQNKIRRREEALLLAQRSTGLQQAEIARLRDAMEKSGAEKGTRFKKRPSQWSLDEYRAEYDRLNVELSKLREQLSTAYDREANQISFLKAELQQLGEQIMASVVPAAANSGMAAAMPQGTVDLPGGAGARPARVPPRRPPVDRRLSRPEPWQRSAAPVEAEPVEKSPADKPEIVRNGSAPKLRRPAGIDDFANKSLEEVLEAALPLSGEVLIVREDKPATPENRRPALSSPVLMGGAPEGGTAGNPEAPRNVDAAVAPEAAEQTLADILGREMGILQSAPRTDSEPLPVQTSAPTTMDAAHDLRAGLAATSSGDEGVPSVATVDAGAKSIGGIPNGPAVAAPSEPEKTASTLTAEPAPAPAAPSAKDAAPPSTPGTDTPRTKPDVSNDNVEPAIGTASDGTASSADQSAAEVASTGTSPQPKEADSQTGADKPDVPEEPQRGIRTLLERLRGVQERTPA